MTDDPATLTLVSATLVYDIISATNSSPQTTEINAVARADTLMKWVYLGLAQAGALIAVGVAIQVMRGQAWWPILLGAALAAGLLWIQYVHARNSGIASAAQGAPGTEQYR